MKIDPKLISLVSSPVNAGVLETVLKQKKISRFDLVTKLSEFNAEQIEQSINVLTNNGLLENTGSSDWDKIYVTGNTFQIAEFLNQLKS